MNIKTVKIKINSPHAEESIFKILNEVLAHEYYEYDLEVTGPRLIIKSEAKSIPRRTEP